MLLQPSRTKRLPKKKSRTRARIVKAISVLAVIVLVEVGARGCVNAVTSRSIENRTTGVRTVSVASGDVPVVFHYWIMGRLSNGSVTLHDIMASPVNISALTVQSSDLRLSRTKMISGRAKITGTAPYRTTVYLSPKNLGDSLNASVTFQSQNLVATIEGHNMNVIPKVQGRKIVIADDRYRYEVPLPGLDYLPCKPDSFGIGNGISVSCDAKTLPRVVANATK